MIDTYTSGISKWQVMYTVISSKHWMTCWRRRQRLSQKSPQRPFKKSPQRLFKGSLQRPFKKSPQRLYKGSPQRLNPQGRVAVVLAPAYSACLALMVTLVSTFDGVSLLGNTTLGRP